MAAFRPKVYTLENEADGGRVKFTVYQSSVSVEWFSHERGIGFVSCGYPQSFARERARGIWAANIRNGYRCPELDEVGAV